MLVLYRTFSKTAVLALFVKTRDERKRKNGRRPRLHWKEDLFDIFRIDNFCQYNTAMVLPSSSSRIGLGMAALGRPGYINLDRCATFGYDHSKRSVDRMQAQSNLVLDRLFQLSSAINNQQSGTNTDDKSNAVPWIDCARSYGLSEQFVGEYL